MALCLMYMWECVYIRCILSVTHLKGQDVTSREAQVCYVSYVHVAMCIRTGTLCALCTCRHVYAAVVYMYAMRLMYMWPCVYSRYILSGMHMDVKRCQ